MSITLPSHVRALFNRIMADLGHKGWALNATTDCYCWRTKKRIDLNPQHDGLAMLLLHEIAHIDAPPVNGNYHSPAFFDRMEALARRYLRTRLDSYHLWLRDVYLGRNL